MCTVLIVTWSVAVTSYGAHVYASTLEVDVVFGCFWQLCVKELGFICQSSMLVV